MSPGIPFEFTKRGAKDAIVAMALFALVSLVSSDRAWGAGDSHNDFVMLYQFPNMRELASETDRQMSPILPVSISYQGRFRLKHGDSNQKVPSAAVLDRAARLIGSEMRRSGHDLVILDVENWATGAQTPTSQFRESVAKYVDFIRQMKRRLPAYRVGNYGKPVHRDYRASLQQWWHSRRWHWKERNDELQPLADVVDVFYPSLYTFELDDHSAWKRYAESHIAESRRLAKAGQPVIAFIWPMYHERSKHKGKFIGYDFWLLQLQTLSEIADGVVIWSNHPGPLDEHAPWFRATQDFVRARLNQGRGINGQFRNVEKESWRDLQAG